MTFTNLKLKVELNGFSGEKTKTYICIFLESVLHFRIIKFSGVGASLTTVGRFGDLKQHSSRLQVSDFEACKINVVDIVLRFTKIVWNELEQREFMLRQSQT